MAGTLHTWITFLLSSFVLASNNAATSFVWHRGNCTKSPQRNFVSPKVISEKDYRSYSHPAKTMVIICSKGPGSMQ